MSAENELLYELLNRRIESGEDKQILAAVPKLSDEERVESDVLANFATMISKAAPPLPLDMSLQLDRIKQRVISSMPEVVLAPVVATAPSSGRGWTCLVGFVPGLGWRAALADRAGCRGGRDRPRLLLLTGRCCLSRGASGRHSLPGQAHQRSLSNRGDSQCRTAARAG